MINGAQSIIISKSYAERCGLLRLLDQRYKGIAHGVGQSKILGRIHVAPIKIGNIFYPCSFLVLDSPNMEFLFGLDMLRKHQCIIDLKENVLRVGGGEVSVPFLQEKDILSRFLDEERYSKKASSSRATVTTATTEKNANVQYGAQSSGGARGDVTQRPIECICKAGEERKKPDLMHGLHAFKDPMVPCNLPTGIQMSQVSTTSACFLEGSLMHVKINLHTPQFQFLSPCKATLHTQLLSFPSSSSKHAKSAHTPPFSLSRTLPTLQKSWQKIRRTVSSREIRGEESRRK